MLEDTPVLPPYALALTLTTMVALALVFRSCIQYFKHPKPSGSTESEINQAREDVAKARELMKSLVLQLIPYAPGQQPSSSTTSNGTTSIDSMELMELLDARLDARLSVFEAHFLKNISAQTNDVTNSKLAVVQTEADLKAAQVEYNNKITELELNYKHTIAEVQILLDAEQKKLLEQRKDHEDALKGVAASNEAALDALKEENAVANDKAEAAVKKYHKILSEKFDELHGETLSESNEIKTENNKLKIQLAQFKQAHVDLIALQTKHDGALRDHARQMESMNGKYASLETTKEELQSNLTVTTDSLKQQIMEHQSALSDAVMGKKKLEGDHQEAMVTLREAMERLEKEKNVFWSDVQQAQKDLTKARAEADTWQKTSNDSAAAVQHLREEIETSKIAASAQQAEKAELERKEVRLREELEASRALTSIEVEARETAAAVATADATIIKPNSDLVSSSLPLSSTSSSSSTTSKVDTSSEAETKFKEQQKVWEKAAVASLTLAMKECGATELYKSLRDIESESKDGKEVQGTVVKMTAAFAMQLLVDNALPSIDKLDKAIEAANNTVREQGFNFVKGGTEVYDSAIRMQEELKDAIQNAQEKISGDEAREEARAAAAARGMPDVLQWTAQRRSLVKTLWSKHAPPCMRYTNQELVQMNHVQKYVFVPDKENVYVPAKVIREENEVLECVTKDGHQRSVQRKNKDGDIAVHPISDLSALCLAPDNFIDSDMNKAMLLFNVHTRFSNTRWYSWMGPILLSVNPFQWTDGLYAKDVIQFYVDQRVRKVSNRDCPPHVFAVAERAFMALAKKGANGEAASDLSIVVSGESGAGKTEAAKQNLLYLAAVSMANKGGNSSGSGSSDSGETKSKGSGSGGGRTLRSTRSMLAMGYCPGVSTGVVDKIISANPILEAFGNAKTTRNNNSSRFGKWLQVVYDDSLSIIGSKNRTFLLEKSRVVHQAAGEHNFHIFYLLLLGAPEGMRQTLKLGSVELASWKYVQWEGSDPKINKFSEHYEELIASFSSLNFTEAEVQEILQLLAGILHLGNCEYVPLDVHNSEGSELTQASKHWIASASSLLSVDANEMELWTTKDQTSVQKAGVSSFTRKFLNVLDAVGARDSAAKAVYSKLFDWLVGRINDVCLPLEMKSRQKNFIGLLDIFGFERFTSNGFDQLCINLANEKLQQVFSKSTFDKEIELYKSEGVVDIPKIDIPDNSNVLNHLNDLFKMLQDLVKSKHNEGNPSDKFFKQVTNKYPQQIGRKKKKGQIIHTTIKGEGSFIVTHFAGEVEYNDWKNFYARSLDVLSSHLHETLAKSTNSVMNELFKATATEGTSNNVGDLGVSSRKKKKKKLSVGKQFQNALTQLVDSIGRTDVHYIRCLKSNIDQNPMQFDQAYVERQMEQAGLPAAGKILVAGYPHKFSHYDFYMMNRDLVSWGREMTRPLEFCQEFVNHVKTEFSRFSGAVVGKQLVMLDITQQKVLRKFCQSRLAVIKIQAMYKGNKIRQSKTLIGKPQKVRKQSTIRRYSSMKDILF